MTDFSFPKSQRLTGEIRIARLFTEGKAFIVYPLRVLYLPDEKLETANARIVISVPKKRRKRAVSRNLLKRRIREAYRLHKSPLFSLLDGKSYSLNIGINYVANDELPFKLIEAKMQEALARIAEQLPA
ncbi:MAG: ribonuclease P protein component [Prevotellaceae bacterium]|jgi:ribonuclease P protein component|nr:ribonuclease P protein component [Prevotellaceae bacterium]